MLNNRKRYGFNVWDIASAKAVIDGARCMGAPIFLQVSSKVYSQMDAREFIGCVKAYIRKTGAEVTVHLDHATSLKQIAEAIEIGWDAVMYDGSSLPIEENISNTQAVLEMAKEKGVLVEAELGQIAGVEEDILVERGETVTAQMAWHFIRSAPVDLLAVAIGTAHGPYGLAKPRINHRLIEDIGNLTETHFVVHGGSGLEEDVLRQLFFHKNVLKINISTDVKQAYRNGVLKAMAGGLLEADKFDATKVNRQIYETIKAMVIEKIEILAQVK